MFVYFYNFDVIYDVFLKKNLFFLGDILDIGLMFLTVLFWTPRS